MCLLPREVHVLLWYPLAPLAAAASAEHLHYLGVMKTQIIFSDREVRNLNILNILNILNVLNI